MAKPQQSDGSSDAGATSVEAESDGLIEEVSEIEDLSDIAVELSSTPTLYSTPPDHPRAGKVYFFPPKPRKPAGAEGEVAADGAEGGSPESWSSLAPVLPPPTPLRKPLFGGAAANPPELTPAPVEANGSTAVPRAGSTVAPASTRPAKAPRPANAVRSAALRTAEEPTGEIEVPKRRRGGALKGLTAVACCALLVGGGTWLVRTRGSGALRAALVKLGKARPENAPDSAPARKGSTEEAEKAIAADPDLAPPDFEAAFPARGTAPSPAAPALPPRTAANAPAGSPAAHPSTPGRDSAKPPAMVASANPVPGAKAAASPAVPAAPAPEDFGKLLKQGQEAAKAGKHGNAVPAFRKALAANPSSVDAKAGLGTALIHSSRTNEGYLEAVKLLREVVAAEPGRASAWFSLGTGNQFIGRGKDAVEAYKHFLEIEPEGSTADEVRSILKDLGG